ncbi:putative disease resistance protein RGA4 [Vitis vinifera]|uniref:Putative disease resistance protein RGA4 n=1 Tax=Vitis vinifera TaxID=29760 RepID=A0A438I9V7_VITVI|nr:putative disease resistance protein RGA4 [Vitis vinifera]
MSSRVKNIKEEVDEIVKEMNLLKLVQGNIVQREVESSWRETHSFVLTSKIVGREENKEEIIKSLVSSDNQEIPSMVAIVGIGGVGKTTLAQLVYNAEKVVQCFEPRIWVCVSDHFDVKSLVKKILKEVCNQDVERLELNGLKNLLHENISQKRCLLVLDDVWNENPEKWDQLKSLLMVVGKGRELTSLQSLPVFAVGNVRRAGRLSELKELNNLRGGLWIQGLENSSEDVESVLEGLQPHRNLKKLCIEGYGGIRFPSWMMNGGLSSMLPNLTTVNLEGCSRCQTLPCFVRLPHLKSLQLDDLEKVEYMECSSEGPFFPSLENLNVNRMPKLKELWRRGLPTHPPPSLPCLSKLKIYFCDELASLELHSSPLLSQLEIHHCPKLTSLRLPQSPLLSRLDIRFCGDLASLELHSSPLLSSLKIFDCPKLTSVQASSLPCLKELKLMKVRDEVLRQSLLATASSLESVSIERIDDLMTLPDELHQHVSTLQTLEIWNCTRLATLPHWIGNLSSLTQLRICDCPN